MFSLSLAIQISASVVRENLFLEYGIKQVIYNILTSPEHLDTSATSAFPEENSREPTDRTNSWKITKQNYIVYI